MVSQAIETTAILGRWPEAALRGQRWAVLSCGPAMIQIACGPMNESAFAEEISFVCSLLQITGVNQVAVMFGWACAEQHQWKEFWVPAGGLLAHIERSIDDCIYRPASSDVFIKASDQLIVHLCHEADIHITTASPTIIGQCASRWLSQNQRLIRSDQVPPSANSWREIRTVEEATSGV